MKIFLSIICKDNATTLPRLLESLSREKVVVGVYAADTGSTDNTCEILESYGAQVIHLPWADDFSAPKNAILTQVPPGSWVLSLDSDEYVTPGFGDRLRYAVELLESQNRAEFGVSVWMQNYSDSHGFANILPMFAPRVFKNLPGTVWQFPIHEQVHRDGQPVMFVQDNQLVVHHTGYLTNEFTAHDKQNRNLRLLRKAVEESPDQPWFHYNLAEQLFSVSDLSMSEFHYRECIRLSTEQGTAGLSAAIYSRMRVVNCLVARKDFTEARVAGDQLVIEHPDYAEGLAATAEAYFNIHQHYIAAQLYERAIFIGSKVKSGEMSYPYVGDESIRSWRGAILQGRNYAMAREYVRAIESYAEAVQLGSPVPDPLIEGAACLVAVGRTDLAFAQLDSVNSVYPDHPRAAALRSQIASEQIKVSSDVSIVAENGIGAQVQ